MRSIGYRLSRKMIFSTCISIEQILDEIKPKYIFSRAVDSYVIDILARISKKKKVPFLSIIGVPILGYFRVTIYGEKNLKKKKVFTNKSLIKKILLKKNYVPKWLEKDLFNVKRKLIIRWFKNCLRIPFFLLRHLLIDKYNHHYLASYIIAKKHFSFIPCREPGNINWIDVLNKKKINIYLPLQAFPESTIDYWCNNLEYIDYYNNLFKLIKKFSKLNFFLKEHPSVLGARPKNLYNKLSNFKNVTFIPTFTNSNMILEKIDCVFLYTGTIGLEALIRGKPVISFTKSYYSYGPRFKIINKNTKLKEIEMFINKFKNKKITFNEQDKIINNFSKQLFKGKLKSHLEWNKKNSEDIMDAKKIAKSLKDQL